MLNCAKGTSMYLQLMIEICIGLRRGELLALKWHHIDFENGILSVEENLVTVVNEQITKTPKIKSGKRSVQIPQTLLELLKNTRVYACEDRFLYVRRTDHLIRVIHFT